MLIGAMNHPQEDVIDEIKWMAAMGLEFIDLTLEPPCAAAWRVEPRSVRRAIEDHGLKVIGHTAYYLPIGSPFEKVRRAAVDELSRCLDVFAQVGAPWMNVHPDRYAPMHDRAFYVQRDIQSLEELLDAAHSLGMGVMVENLPGDFNTVEQLSELLEPLPRLGVHLDIGHANLLATINTSDSIIATYGSRLRHVHLHDNKGGNADLHLPLGVGTIDVKRHIRNLKESGYDGTITLEVFTPDRAHLAYSRDVLRKMWDELQ